MKPSQRVLKKIIFVTSYTKRALEDYFDTNYELESRLKTSGKDTLLKMIHNLVPSDVSIAYVRQSAPLGLGHSILCAQPLVGNEPFVVLLADDVIDAEQPCIGDMIAQYEQQQTSILAVQTVPKADTGAYGIVCLQPNQTQIKSIVEKPLPEQASSSLAVIGRYVLTPPIFNCLATTSAGVGGEIQLTDALVQLLRYEPIHIHRVKGKRYDCGSLPGWLAATLAFAKRDPTLASIIEDCAQNKKEMIG